MFSLNPSFRIVRYSPITAAFGSVKYQFDGPFSLGNLTQEVGEVVESIGYSLKRAYDVKTTIEQPKINILSTRVTPISSELNKREFDLDLRYVGNQGLMERIKTVCTKMFLEKKDNAILTRNDKRGFYFFHNLKESFDPVSTGNLLKATESILLKDAGQRLETVKSEIQPDYLEVDIEIREFKNYIV
ncbi:MAG: hypothetical protein V1818_01905 [Candidatus Aenigmatarchaeota archaeon]